MKKLLVFLIAAAISISLNGCEKKDDDTAKNNTAETDAVTENAGAKKAESDPIQETEKENAEVKKEAEKAEEAEETKETEETKEEVIVAEEDDDGIQTIKLGEKASLADFDIAISSVEFTEKIDWCITSDSDGKIACDNFLLPAKENGIIMTAPEDNVYISCEFMFSKTSKNKFKTTDLEWGIDYDNGYKYSCFGDNPLSHNTAWYRIANTEDPWISFGNSAFQELEILDKNTYVIRAVLTVPEVIATDTEAPLLFTVRDRFSSEEKTLVYKIR